MFRGGKNVTRPVFIAVPTSDIFVNDNRIKTKIQNEFVNENWNRKYNFLKN